jgi:hypothetical protein
MKDLTGREFLEIALKTGAGVTASAAAFGSQGAYCCS